MGVRVKTVGMAALGALIFAGCIPTPRVGTFGTDAFYLTRDHYRVSYVTAGTTDVLPPDWALENFERIAEGVGPAVWTGDFVRSIALDENDDGRPERRQIIERYDLRFRHRIDGTLLFARTTPVPPRAADRALDVVAHDFLDRVGVASRFSEIDWSSDVAAERRNATAIRAEGPVVIDGVPGYWVTFDITSLDPREIEAGHEGERVTVVIVRPSARWTREPRAYTPDARDGWPMFVMFGYASPAEHHDAHRDVLDDLLRRVDFHETP